MPASTAVRIYAGQLAVLGRGARGDVLRYMQAQEQRNRAARRRN